MEKAKDIIRDKRKESKNEKKKRRESKNEKKKRK